MNIALTGSSGLIGSLLAQDLKKIGHNILCISSSQSLHESNIFLYDEILSGNHSFQADCLLHLASQNSELISSDVNTEVSISHKAIECMMALGCKKIIFFSSIKVYGDNSFEYRKIEEDSNLEPTCFYGAAKKKCEAAISQLASQKDFNFTIFRLPPLLTDHPKSNLGKLFQLAQKGYPIPSFRAGDSNLRSFLPYSLLKQVIEIALNDTSKINNQILNLTNAKPISTNALFALIGDKVGKTIRIIYLPNFIFYIMRRITTLELLLCRLYGNFHISNSKLKQEFTISDED
jgi:UDP-glucose 4-epimerase|tara:strand:+ start:3477 stop:4346 length:870 start_codon:yes stop_codon:yes gene_type:complete